VTGQHDRALIFRSLQGAWANIIKTIGTKYIPLIIVIVMSNFVPPITVVMARFSLAEVLPPFDLWILFLQCFFAMVMLLGAAQTPGMTTHMTANIKMEHFMYVLQVVNTVTSAGGNIATRHMKKFHESVITWYANWSILLTSLLMVAISGKGLAIFYTFSEFSWLLLIVNGVTATTFQMARTKAY
jgi:hypothetical protein